MGPAWQGGLSLICALCDIKHIFRSRMTPMWASKGSKEWIPSLRDFAVRLKGPLYCQKILASWIWNTMGPLMLHPSGSVPPHDTTAALVPVPPLLSNCRTRGTNGSGEKRRTKPPYTHADEHSMEILLWCWCNETLRLKTSRPARRAALCFEGAMRLRSQEDTPPLSSLLVTWCHQPWP